MNCQEYEADLVDLARGGDSGHADEWAVRTHLDSCASCAARFANEQQLSRLLGEVGRQAPTLAESRATALELRLREAFEGRQRETVVVPTFASWEWRWFAAAAVVVLAVGIAGWFGFGGRPARTSGPAAAPAAAPVLEAAQARPVAQPVAGVTAIEPRASAGSAVAVPAAPLPRAQRASRRAAPPQAAEEVRFIALPDAVGLPPLESGRIVRVEVPVSSLPAFGFAVVSDLGRPIVDADVLVGQDGQPRGIRFINTTLRSRR